MSAVDSHHPSYTLRLPEWQILRATLRGEQAVKALGTLLLPMPDGFRAQGDQGVSMYAAYMLRAQFPDLVRPTISGIIGIIHRVAADIQLPPALEHLRKKATPDALTLESLHRQITQEILLTGRYGLLADVPQDGGDVYLVGYTAETIVNWSEYYHDLYVLDESRLRREGFAWVPHRRFRVLQLVDGQYQQAIFEYGPQVSIPTGPLNSLGVPMSGVGMSSTDVPDAAWPTAEPKGEAVVGVPGEGPTDEYQQVDQAIPITPSGKQLSELPMVVIGSRDIRDTPDDPPMLGVARSALAIYRLDADYRHQLFYSGQETLFCTGLRREDVPRITGAGVVVGLELPEARAFFVGPTGTGIAAHRLAIADERLVAVAEGARLFTQQNAGSRAESGEALRLRYSSETSSLVDVALAGAAGLEKALKYAALLIGANPDDVTVVPNLEFLDVRMTPADALALTQVWQSGAMSYESLYANFQRGEVVGEDRDAVEERDLIKQETPPPLQGPNGPGGPLGISKAPLANPPAKKPAKVG
jgi:Domain of unknown function (DUF4055)